MTTGHRLLALALVGALGAASPALAQEPSAETEAQEDWEAEGEALTPLVPEGETPAPETALPEGYSEEAVQSYVTAMNQISELMWTMTYTGDPDIDFARSMLPLHQAAIEMARTVLAHGDDPELREAAETLLETQEEERARLEVWLEANAPE